MRSVFLRHTNRSPSSEKSRAADNPHTHERGGEFCAWTSPRKTSLTCATGIERTSSSDRPARRLNRAPVQKSRGWHVEGAAQGGRRVRPVRCAFAPHPALPAILWRSLCARSGARELTKQQFTLLCALEQNGRREPDRARRDHRHRPFHPRRDGAAHAGKRIAHARAHRGGPARQCGGDQAHPAARRCAARATPPTAPNARCWKPCPRPTVRNSFKALREIAAAAEALAVNGHDKPVKTRRKRLSRS